MSRQLATRHVDAGRRVNVYAIARGYRQTAVPTVEFYDENGRRHLITFDADRIDALIGQLTLTKTTLAE
jgi:hypothetical protein